MICSKPISGDKLKMLGYTISKVNGKSLSKGIVIESKKPLNSDSQDIMASLMVDNKAEFVVMCYMIEVDHAVLIVLCSDGTEDNLIQFIGARKASRSLIKYGDLPQMYNLWRTKEHLIKYLEL